MLNSVTVDAPTVDPLAHVSVESATAASIRNNEHGSKHYECQRSCNREPILAVALSKLTGSDEVGSTPNNRGCEYP
jgi:hypothetical protein